MDYTLLAPAEFRRIIDDFGALSALANMAQYFKDMTEPCEAWEHDYLLIEAERILTAVKKLPIE